MKTEQQLSQGYFSLNELSAAKLQAIENIHSEQEACTPFIDNSTKAPFVSMLFIPLLVYKDTLVYVDSKEEICTQSNFIYITNSIETRQVVKQVFNV